MTRSTYDWIQNHGPAGTVATRAPDTNRRTAPDHGALVSNYWIIQVIFPVVGAIAAVAGVTFFVRARDTIRRVRTADIHAFGLIAASGVDGLAFDTTGVRGHPRQWASHTGGVAVELPLRASEWCEQLLTDRRVEVAGGPELDGGWTRVEVSRRGRRALAEAGAGTVTDLAARRSRAVAASDRAMRAA